MSTTRRGFLKMLGLGAAAVAVGPSLLKAIPTPKVSAVIKPRKIVGDTLNNYFSKETWRINQEVYRQIWATNPFLELVDGENRPLQWVEEEAEQQKREVAAYWREENPEYWSQVRGWFPPTNKK